MVWSGNPDVISLGAGFLYIAPLGTPEPASLTAAWDDGFVPLGYTSEGSEFSAQLTSDPVHVAEEVYAVAFVTTNVEASLRTALAQITADNLKTAFNGGTISTETGDVTFEPPDAGMEERVMLGFDSLDGEERWVYRKCINTGNVVIPRKKGADKAVIPVEFRLEKPAGKAPWKCWLASHREHNVAA